MSARFLKEEENLQLKSQKTIINTRYSIDTFFYSQPLSYTLIILFLICTTTLLFSAPSSSEESFDVDIGTHSPKEITLKLKKYLENSISVSLDPQSWKRAMELLAEADKNEKAGAEKEARKGYIEAGKILL